MNAGHYTVVVRPFFDEVTVWVMTLFNDANTVYTLGGIVCPCFGLARLSPDRRFTVTAAFTTFEPTPTPAPGVNAGTFHSVYVVAGGTLEDFFTDGLEGDVIARNGNVLTVRGGSLFANLQQLVQYENLDSQVTIGPATQVTADLPP